jgi:hypothetical protein
MSLLRSLAAWWWRKRNYRKLVDLIGEWQADESGYDEEAYPRLKARLDEDPSRAKVCSDEEPRDGR